MEPVFDESELDPDGPSDRVRAELAARAAWLDSLAPSERAELVDQPIAAVERRYASWRRAHAGRGARGRADATGSVRYRHDGMGDVCDRA